MKTWMVWIILVVVVSGIVILGYLLSKTLPIGTSIGITIILNFIVSVYLAYEEYK